MAWAPDYVTTAQLKAYLHIGDAADDTQLALAIAAASRAIDRETNRQFGAVTLAETRHYTAAWDKHRGRWVVQIDDLANLTGAAFTLVDEAGSTTGTITAYTLQPFNAADRGRPYQSIMVQSTSTGMPCGRDGEVAGSAIWGWTAVPDPVVQATLLQASRVFARRGSPFGIAGSPEAGNELRLLARVDPDVAVAVGPYRRWWAAA
jgi:uncharacterized phiE125 gp8 family phage protein